MNRLEEAKLEGKVRSILTRYGGEIAADAVFFRGIRGGFSGSRVFEVIPKSGTRYFLKQWPTVGPDLKRLRFIHDVQTQLADLKSAEHSFKLPQVAVPLTNAQGDSVTIDGETLWDLTPKLDGSPSSPRPSLQPVSERRCKALLGFILRWINLALAGPEDFLTSAPWARRLAF